MYDVYIHYQDCKIKQNPYLYLKERSKPGGLERML